LQNSTPLDSLWSFDPLDGDSAAFVQWLRDAGVTALTGNQVGDNPFAPRLNPLDKVVEAIEKPLKTALAAGSVGAATPQSWDESLALCQTMADFQDFIINFKGLSLCMTASQAVLGVGQIEKPRVMILAEAPDAAEDQSGLAFSGVAHRMIREAVLYAHGTLDDVYMTYVSKWRPPGQRALLPQEQQLAQSLLAVELELVQPHHIILLGDAALRMITRVAESVVKTQDAQILTGQEAHKGSFYSIYNIENKCKRSNKIEKITALTLQKPENMLKDQVTKKRVWQSILTFCRAHTVS
jgi:uracil-DNA glycosylase family 4